MNDVESKLTPFNSALETGIRALTVLAEAYPAALDTQRLVYFDYLVVHSGDAGGPDSLHPNTPLRSGELLVRRGLIERGVLLMIGRKLAERRLVPEGIVFAATEEASPFLDCLQSTYSKYLRDRARWAMESFGAFDDAQLKFYFDTNFERWTREFQSTASFAERLL
jgi:hypothetical protein